MNKTIAMLLLVFALLLGACAPGMPRPGGQPDSVAGVSATAPTALAASTQLPAPTAGSADAAGASPTFVLFDPSAGVLRSYQLDGSLRFEAPAPELANPHPHTLSVLKDAVYYASEGADKTIYRASAAGTQRLNMTIGRLSGFKVSPDEKWIAWSVFLEDTSPPSSQLWLMPLGGGKQDARMIDSASGTPQMRWLMPLGWADDGSGRLFYERSRVGMGGYILYSAHESLYAYDPATGLGSTYLAAEENRGLCLDAYRLDLQKLVFNCAQDSHQITILDLQNGQEAPIPLLVEQGVAGSSAFSPSGQWLAYATARRNPDDEAGQVVVVPTDLSAAPRVIYKVGQRRYPVVQGWLDNDSLLITITNFGDARHTLVTIRPDGSGAQQIAAGIFVGWTR